MEKFRYRYEDRYAETLGYDGFKADQEEMNHFFDKSIKPVIEDGQHIGVDSTKQKAYNLCYDCNVPLWLELYERVVNIATKSNVKLNWDEIRHVIRFTFLWWPPHGDLQPHQAVYFRCLSAFNIPLRGKTIIDFYDKDPDKEHAPGNIIESHEYFNPSFLNVNRFHGVRNLEPTERMILKTHLMTVPWDKAIESVESDHVVNMFDFQVPWQAEKVYGAGYQKKFSG
jgi:hypothetical protein